MTMVMQVPMIASIQPSSEPPIQHVVVPMIAVPAWSANAYYQAPVSTANYQGAPVGNSIWMPPVTRCGDPWQQGHNTVASDDGGRKSNEGAGRYASGWSDDAASAHVDAHVTVVLGNLPKMLCSQQCFVAALEQARLDDVVTFEVSDGSGNDGGEAVIILASETAAQQCVRHFQGMKWGKSRPITARYCAAAGRRLLERRNSAQHSDQYEQESCDRDQDESCRLQAPDLARLLEELSETEAVAKERMTKEASKHIAKLCKKLREIQRLKKFPAERWDTLQRRKVEGEATIIKQLVDLGDDPARDNAALKVDESTKMANITGNLCTLTGSTTKKLWADFGDDDDENGDDSQSTFAGSFQFESPEFDAPDPSDRDDL